MEAIRRLLQYSWEELLHLGGSENQLNSGSLGGRANRVCLLIWIMNLLMNGI